MIRATQVLLLAAFMVVSSLLTYGQDVIDNHSHSERTAVYEIIVSGIYSYNMEEEHGAYGNEVHFTYWFNHTWGTGLGYTISYPKDDEIFHQVALLASVNPTSWLTINAGPNFRLPNKDRELEVSGYLEVEFNYRVRDWLHFGPVLAVLPGKETELVAGFQIGFEF